jgi:hypothetical protein
MLTASEHGGLSTGSFPKAVLLQRLVFRMLDYKANEAARLATADHSVIALIDAEIEKLWPMFADKLDEELREGAEVFRQHQSATKQ